jgi:hypothetical protein
MRTKILNVLMPLLTATLLFSCSEPEAFENLEDKVAGPMAIAQSSTHFFVLNADIDRTYNKGSILVLDTDGNKVSTIETPRLGRFMTVKDNVLIAGFGPTNQYSTLPMINFYDITDPTSPTLERSISMDCSPVNAYAPSSYSYFAVSCMGGKIFMGDWGSSFDTIELNLVRQPDSITRRALYIDTASNILYAFSTDWSDPTFRDRILVDSNSYDENYSEIAGSNEVPDIWEESSMAVESIANNRTDAQYKFLVYDIATEAAAGFPERASDSEESMVEMRWLSFFANRTSATFETGERYYRSNFWMALPHESDASSFYLSQRGDELSGISPDSNAIYRLQITSSPLPVSGVAPATDTFLNVTAAYGHETDPAVTSGQRFTGNFALANANSQDYFVVNDFKDKSFSRNSDYFKTANYALGFKNTAGTWVESQESTSRQDAYFAVGAIGNRVLTGSFYSNELILLEVSPGSAITILETIN